jgi:regulator of protease activity HflC (stomatin/prohibitin superfamily)
VKWKVNPEYAAEAFKETGDADKLKIVHLVPKVRSLVREAGKTVERAEDFYQNEVQSSMQTQIQNGLQDLSAKGILVDDVLMRRVDLPRTIIEGVHAKKRQEQKAEQQKAEFDRFKTEQQQKIAQAEAEREASEQQALQRKLLADAKAYEIVAEAKARAEAIKIEGEALRESPDLIKLRAVEKWNGTVPRVTLGEKMVPLIDISAEAKAQ